MRERNSNIELLRIVAILFVIAHHLFVHGLHIWDNSVSSNIPILSLDAAFFVGVNVFVLVSGYCGIKFRWNKVFYLWIMCAIIGGMGYFLHLYLDHAHIGRSVLYNTIFSISHAPGTWYIQSYILLMFVSPLLNVGLEHMDKRQHQSVLLAWTLVCVYFGWWWQQDINTDGYNMVNFIWLYCIGRYLKQYWDVHSVKPIVYIGVWIVCSVLSACLFVIYPQCNIWTYNNPLIVLAAISFFLFFISFDFESKLINILAASTLGVYLIHENCYISPHIYSGQFLELYAYSVWGFIVAVLIVYFGCVVLDLILRNYIAKPIMKFTPPYIRKLLGHKEKE